MEKKIMELTEMELTEEEKAQLEKSRAMSKELISHYAMWLACQLVMTCRYGIMTSEEVWEIALGTIDAIADETNGMSEAEFDKWIYNKGNDKKLPLVEQMIDEELAKGNIKRGDRNEKPHGLS